MSQASPFLSPQNYQLNLAPSIGLFQPTRWHFEKYPTFQPTQHYDPGVSVPGFGAAEGVD